jgi:hypothetical protein
MSTLKAIATLVVAAGVLSACGSSSEPAPATGGSPPPAVDSFTQSVQTFTASSSDHAAPMPIDGIAVVDADHAQPIAVY